MTFLRVMLWSTIWSIAWRTSQLCSTFTSGRTFRLQHGLWLRLRREHWLQLQKGTAEHCQLACVIELACQIDALWLPPGGTLALGCQCCVFGSCAVLYNGRIILELVQLLLTISYILLCTSSVGFPLVDRDVQTASGMRDGYATDSRLRACGHLWRPICGVLVTMLHSCFSLGFVLAVALHAVSIFAARRLRTVEPQ